MPAMKTVTGTLHKYYPPKSDKLATLPEGAPIENLTGEEQSQKKYQPTQDENGKYDEEIELKPIAELVKLDIQRYGDNAFLMYEIFKHDSENYINWLPACNNNEVLSGIDSDKGNGKMFVNHVRRKLYANAPFNLEWAKAGVVVESLFLNKWTIENGIDFKKSTIKEIDGVFRVIEDDYEYGSLCPILKRLRHPFPPRKELGL